MNFKQAIEEMKKGKKVRRKGWKDVWFTLDNDGALLRNVPGPYNKKATITGLEPLTLESVENVYANDWEVVEEKEEKIWWEPEPGDAYWSLEYNGVPWKSTDEDEWSEGAIAIGNYFTSCDEAEFMAEKLKVIHELEKFAYENNTEEIDWNDTNQEKYELVVVCGDKGNNYIKLCGTCIFKAVPFNIYFISEEIGRKAIETIGADRIKKYYFGVEEDGRK